MKSLAFKDQVLGLDSLQTISTVNIVMLQASPLLGLLIIFKSMTYFTVDDFFMFIVNSLKPAIRSDG